MAGEPRHWIGVVSREHVFRGVEGGFAMLNHGKEAPVRRLAGGDGLAYYSPRTSYPDGEPLMAFTAIGTVSDAPPYVAEMGSGMTGWRRDVRWERGAREVPIADLRDRLAFTRGSWGMLARRGAFEVTAEDFAALRLAMTGT